MVKGTIVEIQFEHNHPAENAQDNSQIRWNRYEAELHGECQDRGFLRYGLETHGMLTRFA